MTHRPYSGRFGFRLRSACLALATAVLLSGCGSVVPSTAARLAALDPTTADPAQIEVALVLPANLQVTPGGAVLTLSASQGTDTLDERFVLAQRPVPDVAAPAGSTVVGFGLSAADRPRMNELQARIAGWTARGSGQAALGIGLSGCAIGKGPTPDAMATVLVRFAPDEAFRPLIRPTRLADILAPGALAAIQPCSRAE